MTDNETPDTGEINDSSSKASENASGGVSANARDSARDGAMDNGRDVGGGPLGFLRGGAPFRPIRGLVVFAVGLVGALLVMGHDRQIRWGVPLGFACVLVATVGALDAIGAFKDMLPWGTVSPSDSKASTLVNRPIPARIAETLTVSLPALMFAGATIATLLTTMSLMAYAHGVAWGLAIAVGWAATCALGFKTLGALGLVDEKERPLWERHGFWLVVFCCALYLPTLGAHSLVDPWETHYGEVSREVLARDDWITIWWAEEGYFLSKPILDFWMQALVMGVFGVHYLPDGMIAPAQIGGEPTHPEWIVRLPSLALSMIALYLAYRAVTQVRGRRAGLIGAIVLATMGDWFMLSHQSITDMPFVAALTASMSLLMIGLTTDDDKTVRAVPIRIGKHVFTISGFHLAVGFILVCALPQAIYLISRNLTFVTHEGFGFDPHLDEYRKGSGQECWMAPGTGSAYERLMRIGKWACDVDKVAHPQFQPVLQGLLWLGCLGILLAINRNERRISRLCFLVAWVFAAISTMGKGVAGFLLPIAVAGIYVLTARKWRDLIRLELLSGALILATVAAPWFVAMYMRMGDEFIQQLFVHHMWKRALDHVHDTNTGDDVSLRYYIWQLGYAFFPWTGLVPAGLIWWARTRWTQAKNVLSLADERQRDMATFLVMWFVVAFGLFTYMKTKFHHYVFPAVPPAAMLTGIFLDDAIGDRKLVEKGRRIGWLLATALGAAITTYGFSRLVSGPFFGRIASSRPLSEVSVDDMLKLAEANSPAAPVLGVCIAAAGLLLAFVAGRLAYDPSAPAPSPRGQGPDDVELRGDSETAAGGAALKARSLVQSIMVAGVAAAGAITTAVVVRDLVSRPTGDIKGQERLIHLFTYRYDRLWPKDVLFTPALLGFGLAATVLTLALVLRAYRHQAVVVMCCVAAFFAAWTLDVYMMKIAPHWGQRPLFEAYYRDRTATTEPLVAFEMNWKGENFYSGGRLVEFGNGMGQGSTAGERASDRFRTWFADMRSKTKRVYFVTESSRIGKIDEMVRGALGAPPAGQPGNRWVEQITTEADGNKFVVARVKIP